MTADQDAVPVPFGSQFAATDRAAEVQDGPRGEAQRTGALFGPDRRLQREGVVVAGERGDGGQAVAQVDGAEVKDKLRIHAERLAGASCCSQGKAK